MEDITTKEVREALEDFAEACADSQTELDLILARIACDFDTFRHYEKNYISERERLAEEYGESGAYMVERDAADYAIGVIVGWAKKQAEAGKTVSFRVYSFIGFGEYCPDGDSEQLIAECDTFAVARAIAENDDIVDMAKGRCIRERLTCSDYCSYDIVIAEVESDGSDSEVCVYSHTL